jgi:hypothetical protein
VRQSSAGTRVARFVDKNDIQGLVMCNMSFLHDWIASAFMNARERGASPCHDVRIVSLHLRGSIGQRKRHPFLIDIVSKNTTRVGLSFHCCVEADLPGIMAVVWRVVQIIFLRHPCRSRCRAMPDRNLLVAFENLSAKLVPCLLRVDTLLMWLGVY